MSQRSNRRVADAMRENDSKVDAVMAAIRFTAEDVETAWRVLIEMPAGTGTPATVRRMFEAVGLDVEPERKPVPSHVTGAVLTELGFPENGATSVRKAEDVARAALKAFGVEGY